MHEIEQRADVVLGLSPKIAVKPIGLNHRRLPETNCHLEDASDKYDRYTLHDAKTLSMSDKHKIAYQVHAVNVVNIAVLPVLVMQVRLWHGNFWASEDGRLIHVIPSEQCLRGSLVVAVIEKLCPFFSCFWVGIIDPRGRS